jgi:hypothetical protein|uniref:hypothetical protein n=1 Tax=Prosthecobacter sp. TaxID=1965333 RepID=UPI0037836068
MKRSTSSVVHVPTIIKLHLVGTDRYRTEHSETTFAQDDFVRMLEQYFSRNNDRIPGTRPAIVVNVHIAGDTEEFDREAGHLAPIVAVARNHGCDVYVIHTPSGGLKFRSTVYEFLRDSDASRQE